MSRITFIGFSWNGGYEYFIISTIQKLINATFTYRTRYKKKCEEPDPKHNLIENNAHYTNV